MSCIVVIDIKKNAKNTLVLINPTYEPIENQLNDSAEIC